MACVDKDVSVTIVNSFKNSQINDSYDSNSNSEENIPSSVDLTGRTRVKNRESFEIAAHYPLGSWERHLMEERLRTVKRYEQEQQLRQELEKECTFQPRVGISRSVVSASQEFKSPQVLQQQQKETSGIPVYERLARHAKEREARLAQLMEEKKQREEAALQNAFHPRVNSITEQFEPLSSHISNIPVEERLLHYGKSIKQSRRLLQEQRQQKEIEEMQQQKKIPPRQKTNRILLKEKNIQGNIVDRSKQFLLERETERALARQILLEEHTFRPKICITSKAIDKVRKEQKDIRDRGVALYEAGMRRQQQRQAEVARRQADNENNFHKPATNPLTNDWIHHGQHRALFQQDFVKRQEVYQRVREEHQRSLASAIEEGEKPVVPRVDQEMIEKQVERLYLGAQEIRKESKKRMEEHIKERECPFKPQLAPGTEYVIAHAQREQDVVKRLASFPRNSRFSHAHIFDTNPQQNEWSREKEEQEEDDEKDNRLRNSRVIRPDEATEFYLRQKRALEERDLQLREQKQRQAMEELCACTFRPRTTTSKYIQRRQREAPSHQKEKEENNKVETCVSGVSAYLQRQAEARRQQREREAKLQSLGRGLPCNGPSGTVIIPFRLSSSRGSRPNSLSPRRSSEIRSERNHHVDPYSKKYL